VDSIVIFSAEREATREGLLVGGVRSRVCGMNRSGAQGEFTDSQQSGAVVLPNQALEPMALRVAPFADAKVAPRKAMAHL
jgi:hypothetical protein